MFPEHFPRAGLAPRCAGHQEGAGPGRTLAARLPSPHTPPLAPAPLPSSLACKFRCAWNLHPLTPARAGTPLLTLNFCLDYLLPRLSLPPAETHPSRPPESAWGGARAQHTVLGKPKMKANLREIKLFNKISNALGDPYLVFRFSRLQQYFPPLLQLGITTPLE